MEWLLNGLMTVVMFLGGVVVHGINNRVNSLEEDSKKLPEIYARRDDVTTMKSEIMSALQRIEDKVERYRHND